MPRLTPECPIRCDAKKMAFFNFRCEDRCVGKPWWGLKASQTNASNMVNTDEAAALSGTTRMSINSWIKSRRSIGVAHLHRGFKMPKWQFEPYVFPVIRSPSEALGTTDGWQILLFLETPHEALDGLALSIALEQGVSGQRIVDLAIAEGH